jgi:hypothetical protein
LLNISQLWSGSIKCQDIYFKKKNVQEILDKFKVNNCNSMSALIEFGLKLNRNQGERHPLQENYIGSYFDVSNNKKARYNLCNKSC